MNKLNETQLNFLLKSFFRNAEVNDIYPGWKNIATKLITNGRCVVAGDTCIWRGGIGNFIEIVDSEEFEGCVEYRFDLQSFTKSEYYKDMHRNMVEYLDNAITKYKQDMDYINEI